MNAGMDASEREREPIYVFHIGDEYLFSHYFQRTDIFSELRIYYNDDEYRFEVPEEDFPRVLELLEQNRYGPIRVTDTEEFAVVKEQYTEHTDILRNSVIHWSREGYNFFVMQSPQAVEQAVEQGATRLEDTELVLGVRVPQNHSHTLLIPVLPAKIGVHSVHGDLIAFERCQKRNFESQSPMKLATNWMIG